MLAKIFVIFGLRFFACFFLVFVLDFKTIPIVHIPKLTASICSNPKYYLHRPAPICFFTILALLYVLALSIAMLYNS